MGPTPSAHRSVLLFADLPYRLPFVPCPGKRNVYCQTNKTEEITRKSGHRCASLTCIN